MRLVEPSARQWLSRRSMLRTLAATVGGSALVGTIIAERAAAAQTKVAQKLVGYQDTPHGTQRCDGCAQYEAPSACKVVDGTVVPAGWCKVYVKKAA